MEKRSKYKRNDQHFGKRDFTRLNHKKFLTDHLVKWVNSVQLGLIHLRVHQKYKVLVSTKFEPKKMKVRRRVPSFKEDSP